MFTEDGILKDYSKRDPDMYVNAEWFTATGNKHFGFDFCLYDTPYLKTILNSFEKDNTWVTLYDTALTDLFTFSVKCFLNLSKEIKWSGKYFSTNYVVTKNEDFERFAKSIHNEMFIFEETERMFNNKVRLKFRAVNYMKPENLFIPEKKYFNI